MALGSPAARQPSKPSSPTAQQLGVKLYVCNGSSLFIRLPQSLASTLQFWQHEGKQYYAYAALFVCTATKPALLPLAVPLLYERWGSEISAIDNWMMKCYLNINILSINKPPRHTHKSHQNAENVKSIFPHQIFKFDAIIVFAFLWSLPLSLSLRIYVKWVCQCVCVCVRASGLIIKWLPTLGNKRRRAVFPRLLLNYARLMPHKFSFARLASFLI